ncbi:hypothetical protein SNEBB_010641, partial [Seison nebaliae]
RGSMTNTRIKLREFKEILSDICGMRFIAIYWAEFTTSNIQQSPSLFEKTLDIEAHPNQNQWLSKVLS